MSASLNAPVNSLHFAENHQSHATQALRLLHDRYRWHLSQGFPTLFHLRYRPKHRVKLLGHYSVSEAF